MKSLLAVILASALLGLNAADGLHLQRIASVPSARELAALPNGDLLVGTDGTDIYVVPKAEGAGSAAAPQVFATVADAPAAGVAFLRTTNTIYIGTQHGIYATPYRDGDLHAEHLHKIAAVRSGIVSPGTDGDVHRTTTVAVAGTTLYASVGSSCNACTEVDPTRATILQFHLDGSAMTIRAKRVRNAIALAIDPETGHLWGGGAGQDDLPYGHPYEYLDDVSARPAGADYGWPQCEENHRAYTSGADCANIVQPLVEFPAYQTIIGAVFYPLRQTGAYAFPAEYRGALLVAAHGSWHTRPGSAAHAAPPRVAYVPMRGDVPQTPVNWSDPNVQWHELITGWQLADGTTRIGRPTGIAVGPKGSVFVADDQTGSIYRLRP